MDINCLLPFLKNFSKKVIIREFSGQTVAIDASCWLHKSLSVSLAQSGRRDRCVNIFQSYLRSVKKAGVTPFVVFDGLPLPAKAGESERRRRDKEDRLRRAEEPNMSSEEANRLRSQAVEITFDDITACINKKVTYIVSPYESDAQIASLIAKGYADFALTEDSDLLAYGCNKVMVKASLNGDGDVFDLHEILEGLKMSMKQFQQLCVAAGCDYLKNVKGIGIHRAYEMASSGDILGALTCRGADDEYCQSFNKAITVFQHQTVFNLESCSTVPLKKWDTAPSLEIQYLCGNNLYNSFANDVAVGNVDTKSGNKINSYPLFEKATTRTGPDDQVAVTAHSGTKSNSDSNECQAMHCEIIHVNRFLSFHWKIPCFLVIVIEFANIYFKNGTELKDGVIQKDMAAGVKRGKYLCTSHCQIEVEGKLYIVLWKLEPIDAAATLPSNPRTTVPESADDEADHDSDHESDHDSDTPDESAPVTTSHCLPFKVLGTCYSTSRQNALKEAFEYLYEHNRPVFAKLQAEPDNTHDRHAVAVYIMSSTDYDKVGYIARELTPFVRPLLKGPSLGVSVKKIRFCTTYLLIGFYLTIEITRRGLWEQPVIKASRKVK